MYLFCLADWGEKEQCPTVLFVCFFSNQCMCPCSYNACEYFGGVVHSLHVWETKTVSVKHKITDTFKCIYYYKVLTNNKSKCCSTNLGFNKNSPTRGGFSR